MPTNQEYYYFPLNYKEGNVHATRVYHVDDYDSVKIAYMEPKEDVITNTNHRYLQKYAGQFTFDYANIYKTIKTDSSIVLYYSDVRLLDELKDSLYLNLNAVVGDKWLTNATDTMTLSEIDTLIWSPTTGDSIKTFTHNNKVIKLSKTHGLKSYDDFINDSIGRVSLIGNKRLPSICGLPQKGWGIHHLPIAYSKLCDGDQLSYKTNSTDDFNFDIKIVDENSELNRFTNKYKCQENRRDPYYHDVDVPYPLFVQDGFYPFFYFHSAFFSARPNSFDLDDGIISHNCGWADVLRVHYLGPIRIKINEDSTIDQQIGMCGGDGEFAITTPTGIYHHWIYNQNSWNHRWKGLESWTVCGEVQTELPNIAYKSPIKPYDYTLGIEKMIVQKAISFYPNPCRDVINLDYLEDLEQVLIYTSEGTLVKQLSATSTIDLSDLEDQIYMIRFVFRDGYILNDRLIKL